MIIEESFTIAAPRDDVASFLLTVDQVSQCVPGVTGVTETDEGTYEATIEVQVGPIKTSFKGDLELDSSGAPERLAATANGRDRKTGSQAQVAFSADLVEQADGTTLVKSRADVTIRGRLGQFGTGVIQSTARAIIREFAACASSRLSGDDTASADTSGSNLRLGRAVARGVADEMKHGMGRAWSRVRGSDSTQRDAADADGAGEPKDA